MYVRAASSYGYKCGSIIALCADAVMPICFAIRAGSFSYKSAI